MYGRITANKVGGQVTNSYVFDNRGNLYRHYDQVAGLTTQYDYNDSDMVVRSAVYSGDSVSSGDLESRMQYTYNKAGQVGGLSYQEKDGDIRTYTYTYASDTLPTKSEHPDGSSMAWSYDILRRSTQSIFTPKSGAAVAKKLYTTYDYQKVSQLIDGTGRTTSTGLVGTYTNKFGAGTTAIQSRFDYTYDTWGNIIGITDLDGSTRTYEYNDNNEVTEAVETYQNGSISTYLYSYDAGGNILTETVNGTVNTYSYDSVWKDKLISYNGKAITYDEAGHPLNYMGSTMTWDASDRLTSINGKTANGTASNISYTYLSDGSRRTKTVDSVTTTYHYNNGLLLSQSTGDETLYFYYDSTGKVVSLGYQKGSAAEVGYFFARNAQGDIIAVYRSSDSVLIGTYEYDLWGRPISTTEATAGIDTNDILTKNPFRYRGYYFDEETGFYYLNARYYNSSIRRFISMDDISYLGADKNADGYNLFVYCGNNPINRLDENGHFWEELLQFSLKYQCFKIISHWHFEGRAEKNGIHPSYEEVNIENSEWILVEEWQAEYHDNKVGKMEFKYIHPDGREAVFDGDTLQPVEDPRYMATFNYVVVHQIPEEGATAEDYGKFLLTGAGHFFVDMIPYYQYGNVRGIEDTPIFQLFE